VLLNFWTYCAACKEEMPIIQHVYSNIEITAPGTIILGVNVTQEPDSGAAICAILCLTFDIPAGQVGYNRIRILYPANTDNLFHR